jgi:hypothetical protein
MFVKVLVYVRYKYHIGNWSIIEFWLCSMCFYCIIFVLVNIYIHTPKEKSLLIILFHIAPAGCSVNFEFLNYTIITSKCKGPKYPPKECCGSFKEFACPYTDVLNDLTNDCASTMFSYINLYGRYPPGLFASECREGKEGLDCGALPPSVSANDTSNQIVHSPSLLLVLTACIFLILLFWYLNILTSIHLLHCIVVLSVNTFFLYNKFYRSCLRGLLVPELKLEHVLIYSYN